MYLSKNILLLEDDAELGSAIQVNLSKDFKCHWSEDVQDAIKYLNRQKPDAIVGDFILKDETSFVVLEFLKAQNLAVPFIAMSGSVDKDAAIRFLNFGAKHLLEKPFTMCHLRRVLNEALGIGVGGKIFDSKASLELDLVQKEVKWNGQEISLTSIELKILEQLLINRGASLGKEQMKKAIWGEEVVSRNLLHAHLTNLRKKLPCLESLLTVKQGRFYVKSAS